MRWIDGELDTGLTERDGVFIGARIFAPDEKDIDWQTDIIIKMGEELPFCPKILDYHYTKGTMEFAIEKIEDMYPLRFHMDDTLDDEDLESSLIRLNNVKNRLVHQWRFMINDFIFRHKAHVRIYDLVESTVISNGSMIYLGHPHVEITRLDHLNDHLVIDKASDLDTSKMNHYMFRLITKVEAQKNVIEALKAERKGIELYKEVVESDLKRKNLALENSISVTTIKENLGEEMFEFYFGDKDE